MTTFREAPGWGTKRTLCRRSINPRPHQCKANRIINRVTAAGLAIAAETAIPVAGMSTAEATATMAEAITAGIIIRRAATTGGEADELAANAQRRAVELKKGA